MEKPHHREVTHESDIKVIGNPELQAIALVLGVGI
jgi:hypothetical protein